LTKGINCHLSTLMIGTLAREPKLIPRGSITASGSVSTSDRMLLRVRVPVAKSRYNEVGCIYLNVTFFGATATHFYPPMVRAFNANKWVAINCEYNEWVDSKKVTRPEFTGHSAGALDAVAHPEREPKPKAPGFEPDLREVEGPDGVELPWEIGDDAEADS